MPVVGDSMKEVYGVGPSIRQSSGMTNPLLAAAQLEAAAMQLLSAAQLKAAVEQLKFQEMRHIHTTNAWSAGHQHILSQQKQQQKQQKQQKPGNAAGMAASDDSEESA